MAQIAQAGGEGHAEARRVLVVNHAVDLGGAELTLVNLLADRPAQVVVTLAVPADGPLADRARALGVDVRHAGPGQSALRYRRSGTSLSPAAAARTIGELGPGLARLARLARAHDLVVTNSTKAHLYGAAAARLARRPCAWRLHDVIDAEGFSSPVRALLLAAARTLPDRIVPVSEAAAAPLRAAGVRRVVARPNGVDLAQLSETPGDSARLRAEFGVPEGAPVALLLGRLTPLKGAEVLFEAMRGLPDLYAIVAGEATFSEVEGYADRLRGEASDLGARVVFAGFRSDVPALLAAADVLVHPSVKPDSLPTAVLEAIAAGVPVVASTAGGAAEILADERGGLLVPPRDPGALRDALARVLSEPALRDRLARAGRERARDYARPAATHAVWEALLDQPPT